MNALDWPIWAALIAYIILAIWTFRRMWQAADERETRRKHRHDLVMARLIFEHKSGSKL